MKKYIVKCPVCKNNSFSFDSFPGSFEICSYCGWEDDDLQYYDPEFEGGANKISLKLAQENYKKHGSIAGGKTPSPLFCDSSKKPTSK